MMMNVRDYRLALAGEIALIRAMLANAEDELLTRESPCAGWSALDVVRHVEITPRKVAANLLAHFRGATPPTTELLAPTADREEVLASLSAGARSLDEALSELSDEALDGFLPGPVGPMQGRSALDLALTELTLHRCDIALALGDVADIESAAAERIIDVIQAWLLLVAPPSPLPDGPVCYLLSDGSRAWAFSFDGTRWTDDSCGDSRTITAEGTAGPLALALAGRLPIEQAVGKVSNPDEIVKLKRFLPGP
jgi:uncharacterized protein (TIGR03083 family)